jgi:hypothetical protein
MNLRNDWRVVTFPFNTTYETEINQIQSAIGWPTDKSLMPPILPTWTSLSPSLSQRERGIWLHGAVCAGETVTLQMGRQQSELSWQWLDHTQPNTTITMFVVRNKKETQLHKRYFSLQRKYAVCDLTRKPCNQVWLNLFKRQWKCSLSF